MEPRRKRKLKKVSRKSPKVVELIIIESLNNNEKQTGKILHRETIKYKRFQEPNLSSSLITVNSKKEIVSTLKKICNRITKEMLFPILHIETHGSDEGLHLSNDDILTWSEFFDETRCINILLKNTLLINLSMCHGVSLMAKIQPTKRAPFRAFIATSGEISWNKLLEGFEIFYNDFFFTFSGEKSVIAVNNALKEDGVEFYYIKSEYLIEQITDINRDPVFIKSMINDFAVKEKASNPFFRNVPYKYVFNHTKKKIEAIFDDVKSTVDYFLMTDIKGFFE